MLAILAGRTGSAKAEAVASVEPGALRKPCDVGAAVGDSAQLNLRNRLRTEARDPSTANKVLLMGVFHSGATSTLCF